MNVIPGAFLKNMPIGWAGHPMYSYFDAKLQQRVYYVLSHGDNTTNIKYYIDENGNPVKIPVLLVSNTDIKGLLSDQFLWLKGRVFGQNVVNVNKPTADQMQYLSKNFDFFLKFTVNNATWTTGPNGIGYYDIPNPGGIATRLYMSGLQIYNNYVK